jgi:hypothetical protein
VQKWCPTGYGFRTNAFRSGARQRVSLGSGYGRNFPYPRGQPIGAVVSGSQELTSIPRPKPFTITEARALFADDKTKIALPEQASWKALREASLKIKAKCSQAFISNHKAAFDDLTTLQTNAADALKDVAFSRMDAAMDAVFTHCAKHLHPTCKCSKAKATTDMKQIVEVVATSTAQPDAIGLHLLDDGHLVKDPAAMRICAFFLRPVLGRFGPYSGPLPKPSFQ